MVRMAWGEPVYVKTREEEKFLPTAAALEAAITPKTKALILNSPNNPNGCVYPEKLLREIADLAVKHGFYVISDEIYEKLIYDGQKHVSIASLGEAIREQTIVVNGVFQILRHDGLAHRLCRRASENRQSHVRASRATAPATRIPSRSTLPPWP